MNRQQQASASRRAEFFNSAYFGQDILDRAKVFCHVMFVKDVFGLETVEAHRFREGDVREFALPVHADKKGLFSLTIKVSQIVAKAAFQFGGKLKNDGHGYLSPNS
jgi:hypothetical protein